MLLQSFGGFFLIKVLTPIQHGKCLEAAISSYVDSQIKETYSVLEVQKLKKKKVLSGEGGMIKFIDML